MHKSYTPVCTNCSETGHSSKSCAHPITSFGTILFRIKGGNAQAESLARTNVATGLEGALDRLEFLLIQRRDSLGFIDILRGKYRLGDTAYISQQLRGMTGTEQKKLLTEPFDSLWEGLWGPPTDGAAYRHEKEQSRVKLEHLRSSGALAEMLSAVNHSYETPEWGFPKGRREAHETEYACALRETWEETGLSEKDLVPIKNLEPIRELFFGSNNIQYCHKYFVLYVPEERPIGLDPTNEHMRREVGDIRWCSVEEGLRLIRPENTEKREVLNRVSRLLRSYCPLKTF